jgi:hypothetical protein
MTATAVGSDAAMSTPYEQWQPSVGDRVRVVMRDETGAVGDSGRTGTIVSVGREPQALCEVEYDAQPGSGPAAERQMHALAELEPIEAPAVRVMRSERRPGGPAAGAGPAWQPTVGDRVATATGNLTGTITAIDERGDDSVCEVAYDHRPGETELPQRGTHPVRELRPTREPSAAVLESDERPDPEPAS